MEPLIQINKRILPKRAGLYIKTFGCQMNEYDSRKLAKILEHSYELVPSPEDAELILVNTCSVRDKPEQKLYSLLGEVREFKERNRGVMIGVGGCVAQQEGHNIVKRSSAVDFVFGTHNLSLVPSLIERRKGGASPQVAVDYRDEWEDLPLGFAAVDKVSVFVSISRGCNKGCTYCIVPTTRGKEVSRSSDEILREVRIAARRGAREVVLLGQTVNSYGLDFSPRQSFVQLLRRVAEVDGIERIRFTSPHPQEVRQDFVDLVGENKKICPHIHMPLQSGSDRILKLMNRNYRRKRYLAIIESLKARVPEIAITTDIIVGFPGEVEGDFQETLEVMDEVKFVASYSFAFSPRPGTSAEKMSGTVDEAEKLRRLQLLQAKQEIHTREYLDSLVGQSTEILLEGPSSHDPSVLFGRTPQNIFLNLSKANASLRPGMIIPVKISHANRFTLLGDYGF